MKHLCSTCIDGTLSITDFCSRFDAAAYPGRIAKMACEELLDGEDAERPVRVALEKLNVYRRYSHATLPLPLPFCEYCSIRTLEAMKTHLTSELCHFRLSGPDPISRTHQDASTAREPNMFASLVIIFPTPHEGGALVLCSGNGEEPQEEILDVSAWLKETEKPSIAYALFSNDVTHEISKVTQGPSLSSVMIQILCSPSVIDADGHQHFHSQATASP